MLDDAELLRRYADESSEEAFAELVRRHLNLVYFAALRRLGGDAHRAVDVTQLVFTALARDARKLANHTALAGWLYTTTRFAAAREQRDDQRRRARELEAHLMQDGMPDPVASAEWERLGPVLDEVVDELNEHDRQAVLLRCLEGRPFADVGVALRLTENAARMRVERALDKLRDRLAKRGITSTAAALAALLATEAGVAAPSGLAASVTGTALAGATATAAAAGGGAVALKILTFMSTTKITLGVAGIVAVAATAIAIRQQQSTIQLRAEVSALREQTTATASLREENQRLVNERSAERNVAAVEHTELMQLRSEKDAYLKAVAAKKAAARTAPDPAASRSATEKDGSLAPGMISVDVMANVGRATPNAAAQTQLWALQRGDIKGAAEVLAFDPPEREKMEAFMATLPENVRAEYSTPEQMIAFVMAGSPRPIAGVQMLSRTQPDPDTELHQVQVQYQSGEVRQDELKFRRDAGGWKLVISPALVDRVIGYFKARQ